MIYDELYNFVNQALYKIRPNSTSETSSEVVNPANIDSGMSVGTTEMVSGAMQSTNFVTGTSGWKIDATGNVEFNNGTFRGSLSAVSGTFESIYTNSEDAITVDYGGSILLKEGGSINFTSVSAPVACVATLIEVAGNVDVGTHQYKVTYVNEAGETEFGTVSNTITVDSTHKQVALTDISISTSGSVTSRNIYRTKAGSSSYYYLAKINDNETTIYTDNVADSNLESWEANNLENDSFGKLFFDGIASLNLGSTNSFIGQNSGKETVAGNRNTAVGSNSLYSNTAGYLNTAVGYRSLYTTQSGQGDTALGANSLRLNTTGFSNTAVGSSSLDQNTIGYTNTAIGAGSLYSNTEGIGNTAIGVDALRTNLTGDYNVAIGSSAAREVTGNKNTIIGRRSLYNNSTGSSNVALGYYSGAYETGSNSFYVDNQDRTNIAGDKAGALLYGTFNSTPSLQTLHVNGRFLVRTTASDPQDATAGSRPAGTVGEIAFYSGKMYICTNAGTPLWEKISSS